VLTNLDYVRGSVAGASADIWQPLQEAREGARRVEAIVRGLQTFTQKDGDLAPVEVHAVIEDALRQTLEVRVERAKVERNFEGAPRIQGDKRALTQVFTNLIQNAALAIPRGRKSENVISVRTYVDDGDCVIEVADTGSGIPDEALGDIFEPFFSTRPIGEGVGLGLAISRNIVRHHGGTIDAESSDARTKVTVVIPLLDEEGDEVQARHSHVSGAGILVVDDDVLVARSLKRGLRDHEVVVVHSGEEALALLDDEANFDVILCDLMMPGMTGMDVHRIVRAEHPDFADRMIFMSGGAFTEHGRAFVAAVQNPFVSKPIDLVHLEGLIAATVAKHSDDDDARPIDSSRRPSAP
jgi:CheY-like chemotaxis protein